MATELRLRRGTTDEHGNFIGAEAEATVDTDKNTIVVHDGQTQGGFPLAKEEGTVIYAEDVSGLPTGFEGQQASVQGVPFIFETAAWRPSAGYTTPEAHGADGNDITDDLASWQAAIDAGVAIQPSEKTYYCSALPDFSRGVSLLPNSAVIRVGDGQHSAENLLLAEAGGITITGTTIDSDTVSSVSVSGTSGDYSVTATVSDGSKFAVGNMVRVKNTLPGIVSPGSIPASRPVRGELRLGFFQMGGLSVSGTTATVSGSGVQTFLETSDLIFIKGEIRKISSVTSDSVFELDSPLSSNVSDLQYWYYVDNIPAGLATTNGTTVTISGAFFDDFLNEGSLIAINGNTVRRVVSVDSDTQCTVDHPMPSTSNQTWAVIDFGELHEGAWEVTAISGNNVTWKNTSNYPLPVKNFSSSDIDIIKTRIDFTGDGVTCLNGQLKLNDMALRGNGTGNGLDINSSTSEGSNTRVTANADFSVTNFAYGVWTNLTGSFFGQESQVCSNSTRGVNVTEGGQAWLQKATVNGNGGIGVFIGPGSYVRFANGRSNGNTLDGMRMEVGASTWSDFAYFSCNGANGLLAVGGCKVHHVGSRFLSNDGDGIDGQNGGYGRCSGAIVWCNGNGGFRAATGQIEANQASFIGNQRSGAIITGGHYKFNESGFSGNEDSGLLLLEASRANANTCHFSLENIAINCQDESVFHSSGAGLSNNSEDCNIFSGGKISLDSSSTTPTGNEVLNTQNSTFGYIANY